MRKGKNIRISSATLLTSGLGFISIEVLHMTLLLLEVFWIYLLKMALYITATRSHHIHGVDLSGVYLEPSMLSYFNSISTLPAGRVNLYASVTIFDYPLLEATGTRRTWRR